MRRGRARPVEREPRVVRVLAVLPALVAAAGKVVDRVLDARRGKLEAVLCEKENGFTEAC